MRNEPVKLLDVVALLVDKPADGLVSGHVGTVGEVFSPEVFEVEFLDPAGRDRRRGSRCRPVRSEPGAAVKCHAALQIFAPLRR